jgi:hypothetical protein
MSTLRDSLIFQKISVGLGTNSDERLPRLHRAESLRLSG